MIRIGQAVTCNGNKQGRVIGIYSSGGARFVNSWGSSVEDPGIVEVRLWDGFRHVGDVCVDASELNRTVN